MNHDDHRAENPIQHALDEQCQEHCPTCQGKGYIGIPLNFGFRVTTKCASCGGSGKWVEAVARTLSGESDLAKAENQYSQIVRESRGGF